MKKRERKKTIRPQKRRKKNKERTHCCSQTKYTCIICDKCCLKGFLLTLCIVLVSVEHKTNPAGNKHVCISTDRDSKMMLAPLLFYHKMLKRKFVLLMDQMVH